jgi:hypothetical protein
MTVKDAMTAYFDRHFATGRPLRSANIEDVDPLLFVTLPDENGMVEWRPHPKTEASDFAEIERRAGTTLHPSIKQYYNSFWFLGMGGKFREGRVTLDSVRPGIGLADLEAKLFGADYGSFRTAGYLVAHGGELRYVPIGLHHPDDLLLVMNNSDGTIAVEDHESGTMSVIAGGLAELISELG